VSTLLATDSIAEALARIASALRTPVLVLALLVLLLCALETGRFATELWSRWRAGRGSLRILVRQVIADPAQAAALSRRAPSAFAGEALVQIARAILAGDSAGIEYALADYELAVERRLERTRILVRAGPALGLMGTLIPLAPGLAALGHGDVATLATDLRTAFAATTIGLLVGTVAYALTLTRTRMYSEDLTALERASEYTKATAAAPAAANQPVAPGAPLAQRQPPIPVPPAARPIAVTATGEPVSPPPPESRR
jgi:biopolymer transport protein ExbB/TolQ